MKYLNTNIEAQQIYKPHVSMFHQLTNLILHQKYVITIKLIVAVASYSTTLTGLTWRLP